MATTNYETPFSFKQAKAIVSVSRLKNFEKNSLVFVLASDEFGAHEFLTLAACNDNPELRSSEQYFLTIPAHALQIQLSKIGLQLANRSASMTANYYTRREEARFRKLSSDYLKLLGVSEDGILSHATRAAATGQFNQVETAQRKTFGKQSALREFVRILHLIKTDALAKSPIGFLQTDSPDDFKTDQKGKRKRPLRGQVAARDILQRTETFYLSSLWTEHLGQKIGTSVDPQTGEAGGPMVRFFAAVLAHWHPEDVPGPAAIRERIRRFRDPMGR